MRKLPIFKLWFGAAAYIVSLVVSLAFVFPESHFPVWLELALKLLAAAAFLVVVLVPLIYLAMHLRQKKVSKPLVVAAGMTVIGYMLLFGGLVYVKLKSCDINAVSHDNQWHCNVSGKGILVYFVAIPILAAIAGTLVAGIGRVVKWANLY